MGENKISSMVTSNLTNAITNYSIEDASTDGATGTGETSWINNDYAKYFGYYISSAETQEVINARARWTIGKGYTADDNTILLLDTIKGNGKDTFNTILENMIRVYQIGGDSFAEIIRDNEENLINLKPLDPSTIKIIANEQGMIIRYEQISKTPKQIKKFKPENIFHLSRNRIADEIHGRGLVEILQKYVLAKEEALADYKIVMHWNVKPRWKHKLKTDDPVEIAAYKAKMDATTGAGENVYEPFDVSESELISIPPNSTLNPLTYIQLLDAAFYKAGGVPQFIVGGGTGFTEASEKIAYLAWQQTIEEEQLQIEEQVLSQLNLMINLEFPASLENELISDNAKDGAQNIDQSELNPNSENS